MLIPFTELRTKYNINPQGVAHIGASWGQESETYFNNGVKHVLFVEAIPEVFSRLERNVAKYPFESAICINACITDVDGQELDFNISSNDGESSSIFEFGTHQTMHPDVTWVDQLTFKSKRIDTIVANYKIDMTKYDFLNVDLQGADLLAIKSMGAHIKNFKYAYIEINKTEVYKGCALANDVYDYMAIFGFKLVEEKMIDNQWGDSFLIKS